MPANVFAAWGSGGFRSIALSTKHKSKFIAHTFNFAR